VVETVNVGSIVSDDSIAALDNPKSTALKVAEYSVNVVVKL
jgi:hypothetical protein